jgi:hypothetical protein
MAMSTEQPWFQNYYALQTIIRRKDFAKGGFYISERELQRGQWDDPQTGHCTESRGAH